MTTSKPNNNLYDGERLKEVAGYPTLFRYLPATHKDAKSNNRPLMVFIPGAAHLARIAYGGHAGYQAKDFLAHWLNQAGFDVLAVSYPLEMYDPRSEVMAPKLPNFRLSEWGEQAAMTARKVIDENGRSSEVILLSWSMGGRILKPFVVSAHRCKLDVRLFVSLASTPGGMTGIVPTASKIRRTTAGYAACDRLLESFPRQIKKMQDLENEHQPGRQPIISDDVYLREYFGHTPVRLAAWGLGYCESGDDRIEDSGFITNEWESLNEAGPTGKDYKIYPFIGAVRPTSVSDLRHVLSDGATWGMVLTYKLMADITKVVGLGTPENEAWHQLLDLVSSAPMEMTTETVRGNHFFFIGETGARATCEAILRLYAKSQQIRGRLDELLDQLRIAS